MNLLVTGGAGFIGSMFVERIVESRSIVPVDEVIILDKITYASYPNHLSVWENDSRIRFVKGDITDRSLIQKLIPSVNAVINFAAESHVDNSIANSSPFFHSNIIGTTTLLEEIKKSSSKIRFLQVSTDEVYGSLKNHEASENDFLNPSSPYAASKASADLAALSFFKTYGCDVVIGRSVNNYGPRQHQEKLIPKLIAASLRGNLLPLYGNGLNEREWIHADDHCLALELILLEGISGQIYNVGTGFRISNLQIAKFICSELSVSENRISFVEDRLGHDFRYALDSRKINNDLGFAPRYNFFEGLTNTLNWYKKSFI